MPGGVTGTGDAWLAPGWRAARPTDQADPWAVIGAPVASSPEPGSSQCRCTRGELPCRGWPPHCPPVSA